MATNDRSTRPEHISQQPFASLLAQFVGGPSDQPSVAPTTTDVSPAVRESSRMRSKKRNVDDPFGDLDLPDLSSGLSLDDIPERDPDDYDEDFDDLIELAFQEDEDISLKNSLISMGRKYAIKGMEENGEATEVHRAFVHQEQELHRLADELSSDMVALEKDIDQMRMTRTKNYKAMADMVAAKVSMYQARLSVIKEMSSIKKNEYDITMKLKKDTNTETTDSGMAATAAVQRLLGVGRKNLIAGAGSIPSYESVPIDDDEPDDATSSEMALANMHDIADVPEAVTDGDKFIQYENEGVDYVLDIDSETDTKQVYAVNKYGDIIPDYPMPSNMDQLAFSINEIAGEATDQLQRTYRLRRDGNDVVDRPIMEDE